MEPWDYEPADDLDATMRERLRRVPREPDILVYGLRTLANATLRGLLKSYHRLRVDGADRLPASGSFILVANHTSHLDAACLLSCLRLGSIHRVFPAAASDYFFVSLPRLALAAILINALPFNRHANPRQSLQLCRHLLEAPQPGNILVLFPEGTRSPSGVIGRFQPGIGILAAQTGVPVIPAHIDGAYDAWPRGRRLPRPRRIHVRLGGPQTYGERQPNKENATAIASELRDAVQSLAPSKEGSQ